MTLTTKEIAYLSPSFTQQTAISLFSNIKATQDGTEYDKLSKKGIIQGNGYEAQALEMLMQIAKPQRCARIIAKNEFFVIEKYSYRSDDKILLVENSNGEFIFKKIEDFNDVIIGLSEIFSMSNIKTADVKVLLKADEMIVLLAIIDIYRKNTLLNYAGNSNQAEIISLQEITNELSKGYENGLVKILIKNYAYKMPMEREIAQLLASLVEKKCLVFKQGYKLSQNYALLATNFLVLDALILLENFQVMANGDVISNGGFFATAGVHNIISFVFEDDNILLSSMSAFQMLSTIESVLECPVFAEEIVQTAQTPPPINNIWQCTCGKTNTANFCPTCGSKRV